ncbi:hypothetical protein DXG01_006845 [Tephrocybe rancida]|nr:hypothetical protein DXG01_006845 [Tephrocybe rancida]
MHLTMCNEWIQQNFDKESEDLCQSLEKEAANIHKQEMEEYDRGAPMPPKTPEEYADAMEDAGNYLVPVADAIAKRLRVYVTIMMVGPDSMGDIGAAKEECKARRVTWKDPNRPNLISVEGLHKMEEGPLTSYAAAPGPVLPPSNSIDPALLASTTMTALLVPSPIPVEETSIANLAPPVVETPIVDALLTPPVVEKPTIPTPIVTAPIKPAILTPIVTAPVVDAPLPPPPIDERPIVVITPPVVEIHVVDALLLPAIVEIPAILTPIVAAPVMDALLPPPPIIEDPS